jgi:transcription termination/antitermination protein NusA
MDTMTSLGRGELVRIAETVAQEKGIKVEEVLVAMEQAIQTAARRKYGQEHEIVAEIDRRTGDINLYRELEIADPVTDATKEISIEEARDRNPAAQVGDHILDPLPPIDLGRIAAQSAKQVIVQKVREDAQKGDAGPPPSASTTSTRAASARSWWARSSASSRATCSSTSAAPRPSCGARR